MLNEMFNEITRPILLEDDLNSMFYSIENEIMPIVIYLNSVIKFQINI